MLGISFVIPTARVARDPQQGRRLDLGCAAALKRVARPQTEIEPFRTRNGISARFRALTQRKPTRRRAKPADPERETNLDETGLNALMSGFRNPWASSLAPTKRLPFCAPT